MLKGRRINIKVAEIEDSPLLNEWFNNMEFAGEYQHFPVQLSKNQLEKRIVEQRLYNVEWVDFIIQKKNGEKIGWIAHYVSAPNFGWIEIGLAIIPTERNKGYGTEAVQTIVDYLFLTRDIVRVQAVVHTENIASQKVLEKVGFKREGKLRKALWDAGGKWADGYIYSILKNDWKNPKILIKKTKKRNSCEDFNL